MDVEPSDGIPDLGSVWQSGGGPLCFSRVIPVPALVLPEFPDDSGHRCVRPPMAECQSVRVSTNKADSGSTMQNEGERCPHSPILALPDLIHGANSPLVSASWGDSDQAGLTVPASGQDLASSTRALEVVGMAHTGPRAVIDGLPAEVQTIASARAPATRKLYSSKWDVFESWCLTRAQGLVKVTLRPRPGYIPKVLSTSFRSQVVTLHSFHPPPFASSEDERLHMLCPVRAMKLYVDRSKVWRKSPQLLICFGAGRRGLATSKQRIFHLVRDAISLAYEAWKLPSPLSLRAHSTRGVASSQALFRGIPLEDICVAAGWSSPQTFVRFYNLDVDTAPGSQVLSV